MLAYIFSLQMIVTWLISACLEKKKNKKRGFGNIVSCNAHLQGKLWSESWSQNQLNSCVFLAAAVRWATFFRHGASRLGRAGGLSASGRCMPTTSCEKAVPKNGGKTEKKNDKPTEAGGTAGSARVQCLFSMGQPGPGEEALPTGTRVWYLDSHKDVEN